jgi:site-specific DNA-methyltransferase (adenine-specific)
MTTPYTLHRGDALAVLRDLPSGSVDAVITDPPYSSGGRRENARSVRVSMTRSVENEDWIAGDSMSTAGFIWTMREFAMEARRVLVEGGHLLAFIDWRMYPNLSVAIESADLRQHPTLVWDKAHFGMGAIFRNQHEWICHFTKGSPAAPNRRDTPNVLRYPNDRADDHPTQKPLDLMRRLVDVVTAPGGTVLDPFMGSGTTGVAALLEGRKFIGVEMTDHYHDVATRRLSEAAGVYVAKDSQDVLDFGAVTA